VTRVLPSSIDYTARDFDALNARLQSATDSVFAGWTDKAKANFGNIIREMHAYMGDVLGAYLDRQARESRFVTCTKRINGVRHARMIGYTFRRQEAATCDDTITLRQAYPGSTTIYAGSIIKTPGANPYRFQVLSNVVIAPAGLTGTLAMEHSETWTETYLSTDLPDQQDILAQTPFLSIVSLVDDVGAFTEVENFLQSESTSAHYVVRLSDTDQATIVYGDGTNGRLPVGSKIITYKTGGGTIAVEPGMLNTPEFTLVDSLGNPVSFSVTNAGWSSGGLERESLAEAQQNAPALVTTNQRCVHEDDYVAVARTVSGIARGMMLTADNTVGIVENTGILSLVATGAVVGSGGRAAQAPTTGQKNAVIALITNTYKKTITFQYTVVGGALKTVDIYARVRLNAGASAAAVDLAIRTALADYFSVVDADGAPSTTCMFGGEYRNDQDEPDPIIPWSDLFQSVLLRTQGVRSVDEDTFLPADDVALEVNEVPVLGTVTLINDRTGLALV
jgi:hypothetical protein